ncbi:GDYXXLXY domain-containing protein [Oryzicola mucosus]|uniref:GDYXXLXY domain-containing protein n=1 Tax=Oryzicola mucosus TaxID=2767425 RepID=A0A8J6PWX7_9HYPH|nr:GDYXXLXY domain-containing protein [Oryzicola mucosus]MBD0416536.1 GDYXXLXY domain-containing protein [Oryzicola mucosus]
MLKKTTLLPALVVALAQIGFLSWMIMARAAVLRDGREVLLKVEPVDPRDLLRGDYVRLGYEISSIPANLFRNLDDTGIRPDASVTVRLSRRNDGFWHATDAWIGQPTDAASTDAVDISGKATSGFFGSEDNQVVSIDYGLERFYLPEGEGLAIERDMRTRNFGVKAAVAADGASQIKALMDGDTMLFEEPLY